MPSAAPRYRGGPLASAVQAEVLERVSSIYRRVVEDMTVEVVVDAQVRTRLQSPYLERDACHTRACCVTCRRRGSLLLQLNTRPRGLVLLAAALEAQLVV